MSFPCLLSFLLEYSRDQRLADKIGNTVTQTISVLYEDANIKKFIEKDLLFVKKSQVEQNVKNAETANQYKANAMELMKTKSKEAINLAHMATVKRMMYSQEKVSPLISQLCPTLPDPAEEAFIPKMEESKNFPGASKKLKRVTIAEKDHVISKEEVAAGECLFVERPRACNVIVKFSHMFCSHCCQRINKLGYTCPSCADVVYCSSVCQEFAEVYHQFECGFIEFLQSYSSNTHLAFRRYLIGSLPSTTPKSGYRTPIKMHKLAAPSTSSFSYEFNYNNEQMPTNILLRQGLIAMILFYYMEIIKSDVGILPHKLMMTIMPEYALKAILMALLEVDFNSFAITYHFERDASSVSDSGWLSTAQRNEVLLLGGAVYASLSKMQHVCDDNSVQFWHSGNMIVVKNRQTINAGQEVVMCVGPAYQNMFVAQRHRHLQKRFHFQCICYICQANFDPARLDFAGKCSQCCGPLITSETAEVATSSCLLCPVTCDSNDITAAIYEQVKGTSGTTPLADLLNLWRMCRRYLHCQNSLMFTLVGKIGHCLQLRGEFAHALMVGKILLSGLVNTRHSHIQLRLLLVRKLSVIAGLAAGALPKDSQHANNLRRESVQFRQKGDQLMKDLFGVSKLPKEYFKEADLMKLMWPGSRAFIPQDI